MSAFEAERAVASRAVPGNPNDDRLEAILEGLSALTSALSRENPDVAELARAEAGADEMDFEDVMTAVDQAAFVFERTNQLRADLVRAYRADAAVRD